MSLEEFANFWEGERVSLLSGEAGTQLTSAIDLFVEEGYRLFALAAVPLNSALIDRLLLTAGYIQHNINQRTLLSTTRPTRQLRQSILFIQMH